MAELSDLYASALFDLAKEKDCLEEVFEQSLLLREALSEGECKRVLLHPHISTFEKHKIFEAAFKGRIADDLYGFLCLVAEKNREAYLLPALTKLNGMIDRHRGKTTANVLSACELSGEQIETLREVLSRKLGKQVEINLKIDPTVIGGILIHVDGFFADRTIKSKLRGLTAGMKEGCGA